MAAEQPPAAGSPKAGEGATSKLRVASAKMARSFHSTIRTPSVFLSIMKESKRWTDIADTAPEDIKFGWEDQDDVPYYLQGDPNMYTDDALARRAALKFNSRVQAAIMRFFSVYKKDRKGRVLKDEYMKVHLRMCRALAGDMSDDEMKVAAEEDWQSDAHGKDNMNYEQYQDATFELADLWVPTIEANEYAGFIRKLFRKITVKKVTLVPDGPEHVGPAVNSRDAKTMLATALKDEIESGSDLGKLLAEKVKKGHLPTRKEKEALMASHTEKTSGEELDGLAAGPSIASSLSSNSSGVNPAYVLYSHHAGHDNDNPDSDEEPDLGIHGTKGKTHVEYEWKDVDLITTLDEVADASMSRSGIGAGSDDEWGAGDSVSEDGDGDGADGGRDGADDTVNDALSKSNGDLGTSKPAAGRSKSRLQTTLGAASHLMSSMARNASSNAIDKKLPAPKSLKQVAHAQGAAGANSELALLKSMTSGRVGDSNVLKLAKARANAAQGQDAGSALAGPVGIRANGVKDGVDTAFAPTVFYRDPYDEDLDELHTHHAKPLKLFVEGPPGCGKTTLALRLSSALKVVYLDPASMVASAAAGAEDDELAIRVRAVLDAGKGVDGDLYDECVVRACTAPEVDFQGYVLDGYPSSMAHLTLLNDSGLPVPDFIVRLDMDAADAQTRRDGIRKDMQTGVQYSEWDRTMPVLPEPEPVKEEEEDGGEGGGDEEGEEKEEKVVVPPPPVKTAFTRPVKVALPAEVTERLVINPEDRAEFAAAAAAEWAETSKVVKMAIKGFDAEAVIDVEATQDPHDIFEIVIGRLGALPEVHLPEHIPLPEELANADDTADPKAKLNFLLSDDLPGSEPNEEGVRPKRVEALRLSKYGLKCPVTLDTTDAVVDGSEDTAAEFMGRLYLCKDGDALEKFLKNPKKHLTKGANLPAQFRVAVVGPVLSGKSMQAAHLSSFYHIDSHDMQSTVSRHLALAGSETYETGPTALGSQALGELVMGETIPEDVLAQMMAEATGTLKHVEYEPTPPPSPEPVKTAEELAKEEEAAKEAKEDGDDDEEEEEKDADAEDEDEDKDEDDEDGEGGGSTRHKAKVHVKPPKVIKSVEFECHNGYVVDGFPMTAKQLQALYDEGVRFDQVVALTDPSGGQMLMERPRGLDIDPLSGSQRPVQDQVARNQMMADKVKADERRKKLEKREKELEARRRRAEAIKNGDDPDEVEEGEDDAAGDAGGDEEEGEDEGEVLVLPTDPDDDREHLSYNVEYSLARFGREYSDLKAKALELKYPLVEMRPIVEVATGPTGGRVEDTQGLVKQAIDPFYPRAEIAEAPMDAESGLVDKTAIKLGDTKDYCPVSLKDKEQLVRGKGALAATHRGRWYLFADEESRSRFLCDPGTYLPEDPPTPPPPRIVLMGPDGTGLPQQVAALSEKYGVPSLTVAEAVATVAGDTESELGKKVLALQAVGQEIPDDIVVEILRTVLSTKEYRDGGFLLQAFPALPDQVQQMLDHELNFDCAVSLTLKPGMALHRISKIISEAEANKAIKDEKDAEGGDDDGEAEAEEKDAETLAAEAAERAEALEVKIGEMQLERDTVVKEKRSADLEAISVVLDAVRALQIDVIQDVDANNGATTVFGRLCDALRPYLGNREAFLETAVPITTNEADQLIDEGFKRESKFGPACPVKLLHGEEFKADSRGWPAKYRRHVYWLSTEKARSDFCANPVKYVKQRPAGARRPYQACVVGLPKAGKSTVARHIAAEFGVVHLDMPTVIESVIEKGDTELGASINTHLATGQSLPDDLTVKALRMVTESTACLKQGWVLDGFPVTLKQASLMADNGIVPANVFSLGVTPEEGMARGTLDSAEMDALNPTSEIPDPDFDLSTLWKRIQAEGKGRDAVDRHYAGQYENVHFLDGAKSKWFVEDEVSKHAKLNIQARRMYWQAVHEMRCGAIWPMCVTPATFFEKRSKLGDFCPVSLTLHGRLIDCGRSHQHAAQYRGKMYKLAGPVELARFVVQPSLYLNGAQLPTVLPRRVALQVAFHLSDSELELEGNCPVTITDDNGRVTPGLKAKCVQYDGKIFCMLSEAAAVKFMQIPWIYSKARLPAYKPAKEAPIPTNALPDWGFLDQSVATAITAAMTDLSKYKPYLCYPGMTIKESALKYLAVCLKANNPLSEQGRRDKYTERLLEYDECCSMRDIIQHEYQTTPLPRVGHRDDDFELMVAKFDNIGNLDMNRFVR